MLPERDSIDGETTENRFHVSTAVTCQGFVRFVEEASVVSSH